MRLRRMRCTARPRFLSTPISRSSFFDHGSSVSKPCCLVPSKSVYETSMLSTRARMAALFFGRFFNGAQQAVFDVLLWLWLGLFLWQGGLDVEFVAGQTARQTDVLAAA